MKQFTRRLGKIGMLVFLLFFPLLQYLISQKVILIYNQTEECVCDQSTNSTNVDNPEPRNDKRQKATGLKELRDSDGFPDVAQRESAKVDKSEIEAIQTLREEFYAVFPKINSSKFLIYTCKEDCGPFGDFHEGIVTTFLISALATRKFGIKIDSECSPLTWLEPNVFNWTIQPNDILGKETLTRSIRDDFKFRTHLEGTNFRTTFKEDVVFMDSKNEWIMQVRRHIHTYDTFPWLHLMAEADILSLIHHGLFKSKQSLQENVNAFFSEHVQGNNLVCVHGRIHSSKHFSEFKPVWKFLEKYNTDSSRIYISTGNGQLEEEAKRVFPQSLFRNNLSTPSKTDMKCIESFLDHFEVEILQRCDTIILMDNRIGKHGVHLRHTSRNLFCYSGTSVVYPCRRELLKDTFGVFK